MVGTEPHVVRLNDLVRMDEPVPGGSTHQRSQVKSAYAEAFLNS